MVWFLGMAAVFGLATASLPIIVSARSVKPMQPEAPVVASAPVPAPAPAPAPAPKPAPVPVSNLSTVVNSFADSQSVTFGIYVVNLENGEEATHLPTQSFISASLYKLFVAEGVLRKVEQGTLTMTDEQRNCLKIMITVSDNPCGQSLGTVIGWAGYNPTLASLGYTGTKLNRGNITTTPADVARYFKRLYSGQMLNAANSALLLGHLKAQRVNNRLPKGLPYGTVIAHKTGDLSGYMHDAGIVYSPKANYIVVGMSGPWAKPVNSFTAFSSLSSQLYKLFNP